MCRYHDRRAAGVRQGGVKVKKTQMLTVWLLPLIVFGGWFYPLLGLLVAAMMAVLLPLSYFKGRYWCSDLCPRGAFLDGVMARVSPNRPLPRALVTPRSRWLIFTLFMAFMAFRLSMVWGSLAAVGTVFTVMCVLTTVLAVLIALAKKSRGWCAVCPMGTLQDRIGKLRAKKAK
jgi:polyferredoxin